MLIARYVHWSRWETNTKIWKKFHLDLKDFSSWLDEAEAKIARSRMELAGEMDYEKAKVCQQVVHLRSHSVLRQTNLTF